MVFSILAPTIRENETYIHAAISVKLTSRFRESVFLTEFHCAVSENGHDSPLLRAKNV